MPFVTAHSLRIHYIEAGSGAPVVFVHGNWATSSWWEPALMRLPIGYHGVAPDMRGRGRTQGPDSDYRIMSLAGDLVEFLDALELARPHLVGHSLGAAVVLEAALEVGPRIRSVTVVAPPWVDGMPDSLNTPDRQRMLKEHPEFFTQALRAIAPTGPDDAFWLRLVAEGHTQSLSATLGNLEALHVWRPGDQLAKIQVPKLVIGGENDILLPPPVVERAAEALGGEAVIIPGVGHSPNIEAPDRFMELLARHISGA